VAFSVNVISWTFIHGRLLINFSFFQYVNVITCQCRHPSLGFEFDTVKILFMFSSGAWECEWASLLINFEWVNVL